MLDFVKQLRDKSNSDINRMAQLVINTVHAKALYQKGEWKLVREHYGEDDCLNPHFSMSYLAIARANTLSDVKTSVRDNMDKIAEVVNKKLGYSVVESNDGYIRIVV